MTNRLITIGISHFCEKARWTLQRACVPFKEERHPPVLHIFVARRLGGGRSRPILITATGRFTDSTDILTYIDEQARPELRLYPDDSGLRSQVGERHLRHEAQSPELRVRQSSFGESVRSQSTASVNDDAS